MLLPPPARRVVAVPVGVLLGLLTIVKVVDIGFTAIAGPAVRPGAGLDPARRRDRRGRGLDRPARRGAHRGRCLPAGDRDPGADDAGRAAADPAGRRAPPRRAAYGRRARRGLDRLRRVRRPAQRRRAGRVPGRRRRWSTTGSSRSGPGCTTRPGSGPGSLGRPVQGHPGRPAAHRPARARTCCSRSSRATGGTRSRTRRSRRRSTGSSTPGPGSWRRPGSARAARTSAPPRSAAASWLAHSTLQSGLYINNQQRYRSLVSSNRLTLTSAFRKAGWKTVSVEPAINAAWPEGKFFGYETDYDEHNLGYRGTRFSYATMPDQYLYSTVPEAASCSPGTRRCSPRSPPCRATARGRRSRRWSAGTRSATARSTTTRPTRRAGRPGRSSATRTSCGPRTSSPSSTRWTR